MRSELRSTLQILGKSRRRVDCFTICGDKLRMLGRKVTAQRSRSGS